MLSPENREGRHNPEKEPALAGWTVDCLDLIKALADLEKNLRLGLLVNRTAALENINSLSRDELRIVLQFMESISYIEDPH